MEKRRVWRWTRDSWWGEGMPSLGCVGICFVSMLPRENCLDTLGGAPQPGNPLWQTTSCWFLSVGAKLYAFLDYSPCGYVVIWFSSFHNVDPAKEPHGPGVWQWGFTGWADPAFKNEGVEGRAEPSVWEGRRRRPSEAEGYKPSPETLRCRPGYVVKAVTCLGAQRSALRGRLRPPAQPPTAAYSPQPASRPAASTAARYWPSRSRQPMGRGYVGRRRKGRGALRLGSPVWVRGARRGEASSAPAPPVWGAARAATAAGRSPSGWMSGSKSGCCRASGWGGRRASRGRVMEAGRLQGDRGGRQGPGLRKALLEW